MRGDSERDESAQQQPAQPPLQNPSRRRWARAGMAAPVVLGSLASQPVLGTTTRYWCTISGKLSGNVSNHANLLNCKTLGKSPGYWKNKPWPSGGPMKGALPSNSCSFTSGTQGQAFNGYTADGKTLASAFKMKPTTDMCKIVDATETGYGSLSLKATMLQVINTGGGLNDTAIAALGRATVASLLNAIEFGGSGPDDYPLTQGKIIDMFNAVYLGGTYQVNPSVAWNRDQVKTYFESLYGA
ncbi:hypothetical protein HLB44_06045 [Aquincola sp. S2]|uniref:Uncharacterized protein n=1 Tax=Pseudaquabacterium terrae TaxID=2732868 RepID=A0ABX2ED95_9BURK|nr:hypothetical protein [Aquabacterium terrae]NRF66537.1 hypothetical protein [Aquabacterium terrae]